MPDLTALAERLEKASGPSKELDDAIWLALCWKDLWWDFSRGTAFTMSIDTALALAEKIMPGQAWHILDRAMMDPRIKANAPLLPLLPIVALKYLLLSKGQTND